MKGSKTGILLLQVGSPEAPKPGAVARYLRRFLSDPRLIDLPGPLRWLLVNLLIVPFRSFRSAKAYAKIWTDRGSPIVVHTLDLAAALQERLGEAFVVRAGLAFGQPSIKMAVAELEARRVDRVLAVPLFPQGASATSAATSHAVMEALCEQWEMPSLRVAAPFYDHPAYLAALQKRVGEALGDFAPDQVLFSFHGLPLSHLLKGRHCEQSCLDRPNCARAAAGQPSCYRGQVEQSTELLAGALSLPTGSWSLAYQSRLGRQAWLGPSTEERLKELGAQGQRVAVLCPGFTADCLETLEELGMAGREAFKAAGGAEFRLLPCLNADPNWVAALESICQRELSGWSPSS